MKKVVIIKYNSGNTQSVLFALERIGINAIVSDNPDIIQSADKVIFPGVGQAGSAMKYIHERRLDEIIISLKQPVLGICLGMQLMCNYSEEGTTKCLGIFNNNVKLFQSDQKLKVPQMGWNSIIHKESELFNTIHQNSFVYFVHSYYAELCENTVAVTNYVQDYSAALQKNNFYGVQFHPEKSGAVGQVILENFMKV